MSQLLAILDGGGDTIHPTAYERSSHPTLDRLTQNYGLFYSISPMVAVGSDVAHLHIFGGKPHPRGVFEALGIGQEVAKGETAYKCILATFDGDKIITRKPKVSDEQGKQILLYLQEKLNTDWNSWWDKKVLSSQGSNKGNQLPLKVYLRHFEYHRFVLVVSKETVYENDPKHDNQKPISKVADDHMDILVTFLNHCLENYQIAKQCVANYVLLRGPSQRVEIPFPVKALLASDAPVIRGIGHCLEHTTVIHIEWESFTQYFITNSLDQCINQLKEQLGNDFDQYDLIILHFEKPDFYSHQGDIQAKSQSIELSDFIIKCMWEICDFQQIIVTSDHTTSCESKQHSIEPVPIAIWRKDIEQQGSVSFDEKNCANGNLGIVRGNEILDAILDVQKNILKEQISKSNENSRNES